MPIYRWTEKRLEPVKETSFKLEKDNQEIVELNPREIFGLQFVQSQFQLGGLRIDTLAYDKDARFFAIIGYKKDSNYSVVVQGMSYLGLMLNNKADFILEYNERCGGFLKHDNVDRSQSRIVFISPSFTTFQSKAISFKDLPIELWEVRSYAQRRSIMFRKEVTLRQE